MKTFLHHLLTLLILSCLVSCGVSGVERELSPAGKELLGNTDYPALSYGSFRTQTRDTIPTIQELKEDLMIIQAMGVKLIRTYHTQIYKDTELLLQAISELKKEVNDFEMYVMLGCWMECKDAFTDHPDHELPNAIKNQAEIEKGVELVRSYPDIIKIIAIGNEAMVHWAPYHVNPKIILDGVQKIQNAKENGDLPSSLLVTSSDNFAAWGGEIDYHSTDLYKLISAVDYVSLHTYPFHDTHYNPDFWLLKESNDQLNMKLIEESMDSAMTRAKNQYFLVANYIKELELDKELHIGETGWASHDNDFYGEAGTLAADELKQALYFKRMRAWTDSNHISCFFFEAFDEPWKAKEAEGSENHFGLINMKAQVKYALWEQFDEGAYNGLKRNGIDLNKSYGGDLDSLLLSALH